MNIPSAIEDSLAFCHIPLKITTIHLIRESLEEKIVLFRRTSQEYRKKRQETNQVQYPDVINTLPLAASTAPVMAPLPMEFHGSSFPLNPIRQQSKVENKPPHTAKLPVVTNHNIKDPIMKS